MIKMKTGHNGERHIDETLLDEREALEFKKFLVLELFRHFVEMQRCMTIMSKLTDIDSVSYIAWTSAFESHEHDVDAIAKTIHYINDKFGMGR